jgi:hypothetical protein
LGTSTTESVVDSNEAIDSGSPSFDGAGLAGMTSTVGLAEESLGDADKTDKSDKTDKTNITEQEPAILPNSDQTPAIVPEVIDGNDNNNDNQQAIEAPSSEVIISSPPESLEPSPAVEPPAPTVEVALPPPPAPAVETNTGGSNE